MTPTPIHTTSMATAPGFEFPTPTAASAPNPDTRTSQDSVCELAESSVTPEGDMGLTMGLTSSEVQPRTPTTARSVKNSLVSSEACKSPNSNSSSPVTTLDSGIDPHSTSSNREDGTDTTATPTPPHTPDAVDWDPTRENPVPSETTSEVEGEEDEERDEWFNEYLNLAELPKPPDRIPKEHVKEFIKAVDRCAKKFNQTKSTQALFDIIRLPKTVFDPHLTRRKVGLVRTVLKDYPRIELPDPKDPSRKPRLRRQRNPNDPNYKKQRAEKLFENGYIKKALQAISTKQRPKPITPEVYRRLMELHPQQELVQDDTPEYSEAPLKPDDEDIMKTIKKIKIEASAGPSGWNPRHVKIATRSNEFVKFLTTYAGMMAEGTAPGRNFMTMSLGIALHDPEKDPDKIRPISMGETIYKVCVITCLRKNRQLGDLLPTQLGSGTPGGVEPLIYLKYIHLLGNDMWEGDGNNDVDRITAYNTQKIKKVRRGLQQHNPRNGPLFEWCYGKKRATVLHTEDGRCILDTTCLLQGDPPSGYWFQIADREDLEKLQDALGDDAMVWSYIDDITILKKKPEAYSPAFFDEPEAIMTKVTEVLPEGSINQRKCIHMTTEEAKTNGYETLGGFIGPTAARKRHLQKITAQLQETMGQLTGLRKQTQLVLLRMCIIPSLNHTMRNVDPEGLYEEYRKIKMMITNKIATLADTRIRIGQRDRRMGYQPLMPQAERVRDTDLISLPIRYGGLGMGDPTVQMKHAWEASQEKSKYLIQKWLNGYTHSRQTIPKKQKARMEPYWKRASNQLLNRLRPKACHRIALNSEKSASAWLTMTPHSKNLKLSDDQISRALRNRLLQTDNRVSFTKRKELHQTLLTAFKEQGFEAKLVKHTTPFTTSNDPSRWLPSMVVDPMAISTTILNLSRTITPPPRGREAVGVDFLSFYKKEIHKHATRLQHRRFNRHYEGYTHFPFVISPNGALLGRSRKWIQDLKKRATLNKIPTSIIQDISSAAIQALI